MAAHSKIVGGSSADRLINCPGSYQLKLKLPDDDTSSSYAEEGTAMHEAMEHLLSNDGVKPDDLMGMSFNDHVIDLDHIADQIAPALRAFDHFDELCEHEGGLSFVLEQHVEVKDLPVEGVFGTSDIIGRTSRRTVVWDWKFGSKLVDPIENAQGLFYALGAYDSYPSMFDEDDEWPVDIVICQPKAYEDGELCYKRWTTTLGRVKMFRQELFDAITLAMKEDAPRKRGKWCDFQNCRSICPLHTSPLAALVEYAEPIRVYTETIKAAEAGGAVAVSPSTVELAEDALADYYGRALDLFEIVEPLMREIREQAQLRLEAGKPVIGYKLVPKRATRKYLDEKKAVSFYTRKLKLAAHEIHERVLLSPAKIEKVLKAKGIKLTPENQERFKAIAPAISSGDTLAPWDDPRPAVKSAQESMQLLAAALKSV